jgi:hypothetical protein
LPFFLHDGPHLGFTLSLRGVGQRPFLPELRHQVCGRLLDGPEGGTRGFDVVRYSDELLRFFEAQPSERL